MYIVNYPVSVNRGSEFKPIQGMFSTIDVRGLRAELTVCISVTLFMTTRLQGNGLPKNRQPRSYTRSPTLS